MTDTPTPAPDKCLSLIKPIMTAHQNVMEAQRGSLKYAIECGKLLRTAKETVNSEKAGSWMTWFKTNCPDLPGRTARLYMQLAKNENMLDQAAINEAVVGGALSIRRAAELITERAEALLAGDDDDDDEGDDDTASEGDDAGAGAGASGPVDSNGKAGGGATSAPSGSVGSAGSSPDPKAADPKKALSPGLKRELKVSAPDEVFKLLLTIWDQDKLEKLVDVIDGYLKLKQPQAQPQKQAA
jgi:hypothetical protein